MRAKDTADCPNCQRLQARVDALEAELAALKEIVAQWPFTVVVLPLQGVYNPSP
jgi:hypothetical protein